MSEVNIFVSGKGVVPGISIGRAYVVQPKLVSKIQRNITEGEIPIEIQRFNIAIDKSYEQLEALKQKIGDEYRDPGHILEAHQMMLKDEELRKDVIQFISDRFINVEWAINLVMEKWEKIFLRVENEYFNERASDLRFVTYRILRNISGLDCFSHDPPPDAIVIAPELSPVETIQFCKNAVTAIVTEKGGSTSHTVIIAKSFEIPTVIAAKGILDLIKNGDLILVNGNTGEIIINPDVNHVRDYRRRMMKILAMEQNLINESHTAAVTLDGVKLTVYANVDFAEEIEKAMTHGAEGIGLYRTEFLFLSNINEAINEELHFKDTLNLLEKWEGGPVTIRTFDLGGDKFPTEGEVLNEPNPALGLRSIRLALKNRKLFKAQIRGILRAHSSVPEVVLKIMFPLISSWDELNEAKDVYYECTEELTQEGHELNENISIGTMIELPSACMISDILAREVDFFSIGSNDLIQYSLAVDRANENISYLYRPLHPGVLRMLKFTIDSALNAGIEVSICGDMATMPIGALILMGFGLRTFSVPPSFIPHLKKMFRQVSAGEIKELAEQALNMASHHDISEFFRNKLGSRLQEEIWPEEGEQDSVK